jgi:hypothetical protein
VLGTWSFGGAAAGVDGSDASATYIATISY